MEATIDAVHTIFDAVLTAKVCVCACARQPALCTAIQLCSVPADPALLLSAHTPAVQPTKPINVDVFPDYLA
jgi:hypothetical protein